MFPCAGVLERKLVRAEVLVGNLLEQQRGDGLNEFLNECAEARLPAAGPTVHLTFKFGEVVESQEIDDFSSRAFGELDNRNIKVGEVL
ncbi:hypothetical protein D3C80_2004340 [compost metagenome]